MSRAPFAKVVVLLLLTSVAQPGWSARSQTRASTSAATYFVGITNFSRYARDNKASPNETVLTSPEIVVPLSWDELVLSWNAIAPKGTHLKFEARGIYPERRTKYYTLGVWSEDNSISPRESVNSQADDDGDVKTDTLILKGCGARLQLRITLATSDSALQPKIHYLGLCFLNTQAPPLLREPKRAAWGKIISVPERSQVPYGERQGWCSPTSTSMVLAYWAKALGRTELDISVPEVAQGVYDRNWPGTGNWPFNTAFAGKFPGVRAYVTRLNDLSDLEEYVLSGVPVVLSVSYDLLYAKKVERNSGHLIVCVGFTSEGEVVANDPWARLERGERVQKIFSRVNVARAWKQSHNTVYVIHPESLTDQFLILSKPCLE
jgi:uncharacterized protein YvpB